MYVYFFTAAPDLVPDLYRLRRSLRSVYYMDRMPVFALQCAAEEGCLSSSANDAPAYSERSTRNYGL